MDKKKMRKPEIEQRRGDVKPTDRGDVKRALRPPKKKVDNETQCAVEKNCLGDRGDAVKQVKKKLEESGARKLDETNAKRASNPRCAIIRDYQREIFKTPERNLERIQEKMNMSVKRLDIAGRRKLNEMYTFRRPSPDKSNALREEKVGKYIRLDLTENDMEIINPNYKNANDASLSKYDSSAYWTPKSIHVETLSCPAPEPAQAQAQKRRLAPTKQTKRKPIIKTVMQKGDSTKFYKAVSFVNQEHKSPLNIRMERHEESASTHSHKSKRPTESPESANSIVLGSKLKTTNSPTSVKLAYIKRTGFKGRRRRTSSPQSRGKPTFTGQVNQVEKLAKLLPSSVNEHTKPYYEAWVNTTLAAISTDNEKLMREQRKIIQSMQQRLDFGMSDKGFPEEKFAGRIKVNHK